MSDEIEPEKPKLPPLNYSVSRDGSMVTVTMRTTEMVQALQQSALQEFRTAGSMLSYADEQPERQLEISQAFATWGGELMRVADEIRAQSIVRQARAEKDKS